MSAQKDITSIVESLLAMNAAGALSPPIPPMAVEIIITLQAKLEAAEKDAARYRWLKGQGKTMAVDNVAGKFRVVDMSVNLVVTNWEDYFDDAIDAAMEISKPND
jgi:hypothetical protein